MYSKRSIHSQLTSTIDQADGTGLAGPGAQEQEEYTQAEVDKYNGVGHRCDQGVVEEEVVSAVEGEPVVPVVEEEVLPVVLPDRQENLPQRRGE